MIETPGLTRKQRDLFLFIRSFTTENGHAPSFDEMKDAINLKSKSGIHRLMTGLIARGYVARLPHRARSVQAIRDEEIPSVRINPLSDAAKEMLVALQNLNAQVVPEHHHWKDSLTAKINEWQRAIR